MTLTPEDLRYLDARFDALEDKLGEQGRATVRRFGEHDKILRGEEGRNGLVGDVQALKNDERLGAHDLLLHGEEGRGGIVGDVQDLKGDQRILRGLVLYLILPTLTGGAVALLVIIRGT